jgi:DNA replication licensing factor MCM5
VYTSGKGSSAAGLTASVLRDPGTGEFHLEGGAMVLADNGVVCIDEFDKMREQDRVAIHEAMEQQTISIAKAGITTILNSRASVLAAANPIFGRYDDMRSTNENIEFETTILSRFDLIFIIRDVKDSERDARLAQHIMQLHINVNDAEDRANDAPISPSLLSKYIAYARHKIHPRLSYSGAEMLKNHYVTFRDEARKREDETGETNAIPLTVRQLESLIRIAESLSKMELNEEANEDHVKEAVRLFKVATLKAARQGDLHGEGALGNPLFMENVQKAERNIRRRLPVGSSISISKLISDMMNKNINDSAVRKALDVMHSRGEIEYKNRRKQVARKK